MDVLIVVGMFLTGFDAPRLNTLFVDKNLSYHGLIQAYSRIYDATKTFGNIITFRDLEQATIDAITLFGDSNTKNVVLKKSYKEYMEGFIEVTTGEVRRGFVEVFAELKERFPDPAAIEAFKAQHYLSDEDLDKLKATETLPERKVQDSRSTYNDIRDWLRRVIRASLGNRAKESLVVDFIHQADLDQFIDKSSAIEAFFACAQAEQKREADTLIKVESQNEEAAKRYLITSLKREYASDNGTELNSILPKMSPLNPWYLMMKQSAFPKIAAFVEKFKGVGGEL